MIGQAIFRSPAAEAIAAGSLFWRQDIGRFFDRREGAPTRGIGVQSR
jgi:hypothetical protein